MSQSQLNDWKKEQEIKEMQGQRTQDDIESERCAFDKRATSRSLMHQFCAEKREAKTEESILRAKEAQILQEAQLEQEEKLAQELDRIKREQLRDLKLRQRLRETSMELKELQSKLRAAYVNKELCAQKAEREAARIEAKLHEKIVDDAIRKAIEEDDSELKKCEAANKQKVEYRKDLQDQMIASEKQRQAAFLEYLKDKQMIDEACQRIYEEDQRELENKMLLMKKTKDEIEKFQKARDEWKKKELETVELENKRMVEFLEKQRTLEEERMLRQKIKEEEKATIQAKISRDMMERMMKSKDDAEMLQELAEEGVRQALIRRERSDIEKAIRLRIDFRNMMRIQAQEKLDRLKQEEEEEMKEKQWLMEQIAEEKRYNQLTAEKKRIKKIELRRDIENLLAERRHRRELERRELESEYKNRLAEEDNLKKLIAEERIKMLKEHASNLIGYLPNGVLTEEDIAELGPEFAKH